MLIKKLIINSLLIVFYLFLLVSNISAYDQIVECSDTSCSGFGTTLFSNSNLLPSQSVTKTILIKNNHNQTIEPKLSAIKVDPTDTDLLSKIDVQVAKIGMSSLYSNTLDDWLVNSSVTGLYTISPNQQQEYQIVLSLQDVNNSYQNKQVNFKLNLEVKGQDSDSSGSTTSSSTPTPAPQEALPSAPQVLGNTDQDDDNSFPFWLSILIALFGTGILIWFGRRFSSIVK